MCHTQYIFRSTQFPFLSCCLQWCLPLLVMTVLPSKVTEPFVLKDKACAPGPGESQVSSLVLLIVSASFSNQHAWFFFTIRISMVLPRQPTEESLGALDMRRSRMQEAKLLCPQEQYIVWLCGDVS